MSRLTKRSVADRMERDLNLDSLRGLFLVLMMTAHFVWFGFLDSPVLLITTRILGFVTAADGFYFLSGLVAGIVYSGPKMAGQVIWTTAGKRARNIYIMHIVVLTLCVLWYYFVADYGQNRLYARYMPNFTSDPVGAYLASLLLINQIQYYDILVLYIFFTLITPFVIRALQSGHLVLVVLISGSVWLAAQWMDQSLARPLLDLISAALTPRLGAFDWFAYQALYVSGLILGYLRRSEGIRIPFHPLLLALSLVVLFYFIFIKWDFHFRSGLTPAVLVQWIDFKRDLARTNFPWLRAINFVAAAYLIGCIARFKPRLVQSRLLILLGQNALLVYAWHVLLLYTCIELKIYAYRQGPLYFHLLMCLFIASSAIPAMLQREFRRRKRLKLAAAS